MLSNILYWTPRTNFCIFATQAVRCMSSRTDAAKPSMASTRPTSLNVTFLGTASAQPSSTRNHSSLALRLGSAVWLFDCGEATQHQIQKSNVKMGKIEKIFVTHTHGDHIFGLIPLLASCLNGAGGTADSIDDPRMHLDTNQQPLEIYGPLGTRAYVRSGLAYTHSLLGKPYVVHELRFSSDPQTGDHTSLPHLPFELPVGRNVPQVDGVWTDIFKDENASVSAAPIHHSVPCIGFVFVEAPVPGKIDPKKYIPDLKRTNAPMSVMRRLQQGETIDLSDGTVLHGPPPRTGRKLVILGDTFDPSPIVPLAMNADLLVHEATNAHLPGIDESTKESDTYETVEARTKLRGHSTPQMGGAFAKRIQARKLVLNHFSARYPGGDTKDAREIMGAIAELAAREFGQDVSCADDFMSFDIGFADQQ